jgi:hypothetical protein
VRRDALVDQISKGEIFIAFYFKTEQAMDLVPVPFLQVVIAKIDHTGQERCERVDAIFQSRYDRIPGHAFLRLEHGLRVEVDLFFHFSSIDVQQRLDDPARRQLTPLLDAPPELQF